MKECYEVFMKIELPNTDDISGLMFRVEGSRDNAQKKADELVSRLGYKIVRSYTIRGFRGD